MNLLVFGLKNCDSCRKARKWLDENGIDHEFIDVRENTPPLATLRQWQTAMGEKLLNRRGTTWRQLPETDKARADKDLPALLHDHPSLMKRPILVASGEVHAGFDTKTWTTLLKQVGSC